jgi:hypothetical protein
MPRQTWNREKEPFLEATQELQPQPVGDVISYGPEDPVTQANLRKLSEEEERCGTPVTGQGDIDRIKNFPGGLQARRRRPNFFWRVFDQDGNDIGLGDWTDLQRLEKALEARKANNNER